MVAKNNAKDAKKQLRDQKRADDLAKIDNLTALITAVDAGVFIETASTVGSVATTDFRSDNDEKTQEARLLVSNVREMAEWFAIIYDGIASGSYPADYPHEQSAWQYADDTRVQLYDKFWFLHREITERIYPGDSKYDKFGRKSAANTMDMILKLYIVGRDECKLEYTKDNPDYDKPLPTKDDCISAPARKTVSPDSSQAHRTHHVGTVAEAS